MGNALAYETRVGSPPDFQPKRVSAPSCFRALNRSAQAGRQRIPVTAEFLMNYHTNLPCLRLY
ncbi:hypothetical protein CJ213_05675 [Gardnerella swidsinskii]|uniref:Uncharacterized protein n=1 Tax=Gardnerella swidsinskii TaxID=2792979 RepID=A0A9X7I9R6_9BIFI|nr:hypothetical protein BVL65_06110 [Gardnerella vaginalis]PMC55551.1 hypothetical protein CJ213_05675 [Gardnerella swidsinskii]